jgi:tetratricopeptide (TPR) repeat protein
MDQLVVLQEIYESYGKGRGALRTINPISITGNCAALIGKLLEYSQRGEINEGVCQQLADQLGDLYEIKRLGDICRRASLYDLALRCYNKALSLTDDSHVRHVLLSNLGEVHARQGDLSKAVLYYKKAADGFDSEGDSLGSAHILGNLGSAYRRGQKWDEAIESCHRSLKIFEKLGDGYGVAQMTGSLGRVYAEMGERDLALLYYQRSLRDFEKLGDRRNVAWLLDRLGRIDTEMRNWDSAAKNYNKSVSIFEDLGQYQNVGVVLSNLGRLYLEKGDPVAARDYLERSLKLIRREMEPIYPNAIACLAATYSMLASRYMDEAFSQRDKTSGRLSQATERDEILRLASEYYTRASDRYLELSKISMADRSKLNVLADLTRSLSYIAKLPSETNSYEAVALAERGIAALDGAVASAKSVEKSCIEAMQRSLLGMKEAFRINISRNEPWKLMKIVSDATEYLMGGAYHLGRISDGSANGGSEASRCIYDALKSMIGAMEEERRRAESALQLASTATHLRRAEKLFDLMDTDLGRECSQRIGRAAQIIDKMIDVERSCGQLYHEERYQLDKASDLVNYKAHRNILLLIGWVQIRTALAGMHGLGEIYAWDDKIRSHEFETSDAPEEDGTISGADEYREFEEETENLNEIPVIIKREKSEEGPFIPVTAKKVGVAAGHSQASFQEGEILADIADGDSRDYFTSEDHWSEPVTTKVMESASLVPVHASSMVHRISPQKRVEDKNNRREDDRTYRHEAVIRPPPAYNHVSKPGYQNDVPYVETAEEMHRDDLGAVENEFEVRASPKFWHLRRLSGGKSMAYKAFKFIVVALVVLLGIDMALYYIGYLLYAP